MTAQQAIDRADALRPNPIDVELKRHWLAQLDGLLRAELVELHEPPQRRPAQTDSGETEALEQNEPPRPRSAGADTSREEDAPLLFGAPWEDVYVRWLTAQIELALGEIAQYNNSMQLYNAAYTALAAHYKAKHKPLRRGQFRY